MANYYKKSRSVEGNDEDEQDALVDLTTRGNSCVCGVKLRFGVFDKSNKRWNAEGKCSVKNTIKINRKISITSDICLVKC